ncbi:hypothetical protein ACE1AT_04520 [Pelatocladus sp. BLCC-F211]|uniref:hypothetical protein n=1 Tax=Pelatocladus sp. BLCC-F211 TaxID=3342752 RepID=UPI0035B73CCA
MLEIAKVAVRNELAAFGYSGKELIGLRVECEVLQPGSQGPGEIYSFEWKQPDPEQEASLLAAQPEVNRMDDSVALDLAQRLSERIDEAIAEFNPLAVTEDSTITTSIHTNFRSVIGIGFRYRCDPKCRDESGRECKRRFQLDATRWIPGDCTTRLCNIPRRRS